MLASRLLSRSFLSRFNQADPHFEQTVNRYIRIEWRTLVDMLLSQNSLKLLVSQLPNKPTFAFPPFQSIIVPPSTRSLCDYVLQYHYSFTNSTYLHNAIPPPNFLRRSRGGLLSPPFSCPSFFFSSSHITY